MKNPGGVGIAYDDRGSHGDITFVCLPGWCVNRGFLAPLAKRLSAQARVVTLDWCGLGDSGHPPGELGHDELVADALASPLSFGGAKKFT